MEEPNEGMSGLLLRSLLGMVVALGFVFGVLYSRAPITAGAIMAILTVLGEFIGVMISLALGEVFLGDTELSPEDGRKLIGLFAVLGAVGMWLIILNEVG